MVVCRAAKKVACNTSVLFMWIKILPISTHCNSKTTKPISNEFIYDMLCIYLTLHTKFDTVSDKSYQDICSWKLLDFICIFSLHQNKTKFKIHKHHFLGFWVSFKFGTNILLILDFISMKFDEILSIFDRVIHNNVNKLTVHYLKTRHS